MPLVAERAAAEDADRETCGTSGRNSLRHRLVGDGEVVDLAIHADDILRGRSFVGRKPAAEHDAAVILHGDRRTLRRTTGRAGTGLEGRVEGTIRIQPGEVVARLSGHACESAADQNLAVLLKGDAADLAIHVRAWGEGRIERAVGVETRQVVGGLSRHGREISTEEDLPVRLFQQRDHR